MFTLGRTLSRKFLPRGVRCLSTTPENHSDSKRLFGALSGGLMTATYLAYPADSWESRIPLFVTGCATGGLVGFINPYIPAFGCASIAAAGVLWSLGQLGKKIDQRTRPK